MTKLDELKNQVFRFKIYGHSTKELFGNELTKNGDPTCTGQHTFRCRGNLKHIVETLMGVAEKCKAKGNGYSIFQAVSHDFQSGCILKARLKNECLSIKLWGNVAHYLERNELIVYYGPAKDFPLLKRKETRK